MNELSFEEIIDSMTFETICKVELYLYEKFGLKRNRSLYKKRQSIVNFADEMSDEDYDKLNAFVDGLLERGIL